MSFLVRNKIPLLLLLLGALLFANTLSADRLHTWDDNRYLDENELVRNFELGRILTEPYFAAYIPVTLISYALEHKLWGLDPAGYHLVNLLLHALNGVLVYLFLNLLIKRRTAALIGAILFLCHPVQVESVAWIAQLKNLLSMFFFMLAFISHIKSRQEDASTWRRQGATWLFYLLAVLSKPAVVGAPVLFIAYDYFWTELPKRKIALSAIPPILIAAFGMAAMLMSASKVAGIIEPWGGSRFSALQLTFLVTWQYFVGLINPTTLNIHYIYTAPDAIAGNWRVWAGLLLLLGFTAAGFESLRRAMREKKNPPIIFFVYIWVMMFMLPVSNIIPINVQRADRHIYFPSIVLFLMVGLFWEWLWQRYQARIKRYALIGGIGAVVLSCMVMTFKRNQLWANDGTLWAYQLEQYPKDDIAMNNLAMNFYMTQQYSKATPLYHKLALIDKDDYRPPLFLGLMAYEQEHYNQAVKLLDQALPLAIYRAGESKQGTALGNIKLEFVEVIRNKLIFAYIEAITQEIQKGRQKDADRFLKALVELMPGPPDFYNNIGIEFFNEQKFAQALTCFDTAIRLKPESPLAFTNRGIAAYALGKNDMAATAFERALKIDSEFLPALSSYCKFLKDTDRDYTAICRKAQIAQSKKS